MNSQARTQKEKLEDKEFEKEWLYQTTVNTNFLVRGNWLDSLAHAPFHFIGKHLFVGLGIVLAMIFSLFTAVPFYILAAGFGVIGFLFTKFLNFKSSYPPYFYSYKHAMTYGKEGSWDDLEHDLLQAQANLPETIEQLREHDPVAYQRIQDRKYSTDEQSSGWREKVGAASDIYDKVDVFSSLLEGDLGAIGDLIGGGEKRQEHVQYVQPNEQYASSAEEYIEEVPKPQPLTRDERQALYNQAMYELTDMVGLEELKDEVYNMIMEIKGNRIAEKQGNIPEKSTMHMILTGPPGTGKTVVARLLAQILKATGYLEIGQFVEVNRSDLVAEYQGQTATNVKRKFEEARGGVLFIDEAYALKNGDNDPFGQEAIDTIIPLMENYRKEMVVILAGYDAEMNKLMKANSGFRSRIAYKFRLTDYTPEQLTEMAIIAIEKKQYIVNDVLKEEINKVIKSRAVKGVVEGNGRFVRNFVEKIDRQTKVMLGKKEITDSRHIHPKAIEQAIKSMK